MLMVVIYHLYIIEKKYGGAASVLPEIFQFGMSGVDLFFVISGFVMVSVTRGQFGAPKQALKFLYHRVTRIYPLYWFYTVIVLIVFLTNPAIVNSSAGGEVGITASFLLLPGDTLPLLMVGWTLIHEMYFYLIFFLLLLLITEKALPISLLIWGIGIIYVNLFSTTTSPQLSLVSHPLTLEFIAGALLAIGYYRGSFALQKRWLSLTLFTSLLLSILGYAFYLGSTGLSEPVGWWRIVIFGAPALLVVLCGIQMERHGRVFATAVIKIGDASYSIYLSHILTLSFAGRVWSHSDSTGLWDHFLVLPFLLIMVLVVGFVSYELIEKPLLRMSRQFLN